MLYHLRIVLLSLLSFAVIAPAGAQESDPDAIAQMFLNETLRAMPQLVDDPNVQLAIAMQVLEPARAGEIRRLPMGQQQEFRDRGRDWLAERAAAPSDLPQHFQISMPAGLRQNEDGSFWLLPNVGSKTQFVRGELDNMTVPVKGAGSVVFRPAQPFNLTSFRADPTATTQLEDLLARRSGVMLVATMTLTQIEPTAAAGTAAIAGGQVEALAIHAMAAQDRKLVAGDLIWTLSPDAAAPSSIELAQIEDVLRLQGRDGVYIDSRDNDPGALHGLLAWRAMVAMPTADLIARGLQPDILWRAFSEFAPRSLQDSLVRPDQRDARRGTLRADIDEFERRRIDEAIIETLFPQIAAVMPGDPLRVTSIATGQASEYDFDRGGFAVQWSRSGLALGGQYPVVTALPDFLPMSEAEAQTLLQRPGFSDGPNRKWLTVVARFDMTTRDVSWPEGQPMPVVVPGFDLTGLSIHTGRNHATPDLREADLLVTLDPGAHRGPARPVADKDDLARWTGWSEDQGARGEDLIAAALSVAEDRDALLTAMNRQGGASDPAAAAAGLVMPDPLVLTGQLGFVNSGGGWQPNKFQWRYWTNESPLNPPQIELADPAMLADLGLDEAQDQAMQAVGGQVMYRAVIQPVSAVVKSGRPTLFVRFAQVALFSRQTDDSGLPLVRVVLDAGDRAAMPQTQMQAGPVSAPELVQIDHDYLDLLMIRQIGGDLDDATMDRMLLDRLYRELRAGSDGDLPWGRFFQPLPERLNRVQRAELLPAFRDWQRARADALPDRAVLRVSSHSLTAGSCGVTAYADLSMTGGFSDGVRQMLEGLGYQGVAASVGSTLTMLEKIARDEPQRKPLLAPERLAQIGGRPIYERLRALRNPTAGTCVGQERLDAVTDGFDPSTTRTADAVIVMKNPVLIPNERQQVLETRQIGRVTDVAFVPATGAARQAGAPESAGTFRITMEVSDSIFYGQNALPTRQQPNPTGQPVRLAVADVAALKVDPPAVADILGLSLDSSPNALAAALTAEGAAQRNYSVTWPRDVAPKPVAGRGTQPTTEAFTGARMRIDADASEVLLTLTDDRVGAAALAIGRVAIYDPAAVTDQGLAGALFKKYGQPTSAKQDRRGGAALNRYVWGYHPAISLPHCLPDLNETAARQMRDALVIQNDQDRRYFDLAQAMIWPQIPTLTQGQPDFSQCQPLVVAEITARSGRLNLSTYVIDLSPLARIDWGGDPEPASTADLIDGAADIDL